MSLETHWPVVPIVGLCITFRSGFGCASRREHGAGNECAHVAAR
jgi:hypothetical protein